MKKLYKISWIILFVGLILKFLHLPANGLMITSGGLLLLIHSFIYLIKRTRSNLPSCILYLTFTLITIYLIFRIQFWTFSRQLFIVVCLSALFYSLLFMFYKLKYQLVQIILSFYLTFFWIISFTPSYKILYFFHLNTYIHKNSRNIDYRSWDLYSWFLYSNDKQYEAIEANKNAHDAIELYLKNSNDEEAKQYLTIIKQHEQQIKERNWNEY